MICQHCGKAIPLTDTCIVEFKGNLFPVNAKWIACRVCAFDLLLDCQENFPNKLVRECTEFRFAIGEGKVKSDDKYFNEILHH